MKKIMQDNGIKTKKSQKKKTKRYQITIIKDRCKGCGLCVLYCPKEVLEMSKEINVKGNFIPQVKKIKNCIGCNLCFKFCPDFAIYCSNNSIKKM
jgi:2-oxoglutarate ferredoxin oxidoreductase subunit delta